MASETPLIPRRASCGILLLALVGTLFRISELVKPEKIFLPCRAAGSAGHLGPCGEQK